jgi:penicillin-binding protein 1A
MLTFRFGSAVAVCPESRPGDGCLATARQPARQPAGTRDPMAAEGKSERPNGEGQEDPRPAKSESWSRTEDAFPKAEISFAETGELEFDLDDAGGSRTVGGAADAGPRPTRRARLTGRADREMPAPPRSRRPSDGGSAGGGDSGGNGVPPTDFLPPPPPTISGGNGKPRLKKIRFLFVLAGLGLLAIVSTVFGMMMAVASDLPALENFAEFRANKNTVVYDATGERIGSLTSNENRLLLESGEISPYMKNAVVAVEDSRFYEHRGVDFQGIGRALVQDILSLSAKQGASTITQQFVKEALEAQGNRTVMQKLREAALAYHLERKWTKDEILTNYLNTVYYGQGAYGIEAAARTYFAQSHPGCGTDSESCASVLLPHEAALLAGVIQSPAAYDPEANPNDSKSRRDLVLQKMLEQDYLTEDQYDESVRQAVPGSEQIEPPSLDSKAPYFTSWMRQQLVDLFKEQGKSPGLAFFGGLKVTTTLDLDLQTAAEDAVYSYLGGLGPTAAVVVIDNETGGVKAMVGGPDYEEAPFNLATQGHRQPGSSIKPLILQTALQQGISSGSVYESAPQLFRFGKQKKELFEVNNYEDSYLGSASLATATTYSDNSVYAQVGLESLNNGTRDIARTARRLGVKTPLSTNPAMVLGGLKVGVTPLEWAYAFTTLNNEGRRVTGNFYPGYPERTGPISFTKIEDDEGEVIENVPDRDTVVDQDAAIETKAILESVVSGGTGVNAQYGGYAWGKTGTTENNGDAWFCGGVEDVTACVWVGYPDSTTPMTTEYAGSPVDGGTYPALIWSSVMSSWSEIREIREAEEAAEEAAAESEEEAAEEAAAEAPVEEETYVPPAPVEEAPAVPVPEPEPAAPAPAPAPAPEPAPVEAAPPPATPPAPAPSSGGAATGGAAPG